MEFGIFNLMGAREADKPTAQVFGEVAEQTRLADELGIADRVTFGGRIPLEGVPAAVAVARSGSAAGRTDPPTGSAGSRMSRVVRAADCRGSAASSRSMAMRY